MVKKPNQMCPSIIRNAWKDSEGERYESLEFFSPSHFVDCAEKGYNEYDWDNRGVDKGEKYCFPEEIDDKHWTFGESYFQHPEEVRDYVKSGNIKDSVFKDIEERIRKVEYSQEFKLLIKNFTSNRFLKFSDDGDELDINRLMSGDPEHWQSIGNKNNKPVYRICVNAGGNSREDESYFVNVVCALYLLNNIKTLQKINVEIDVSLVTEDLTNHLHRCFMIINLKQANHPLDIRKICVPSIPAFLRSYGFCFMANCFTGQPDSGLGSARPIRAKDIPDREYDVVINATDIGGDVFKYVQDILSEEESN